MEIMRLIGDQALGSIYPARNEINFEQAAQSYQLTHGSQMAWPRTSSAPCSKRPFKIESLTPEITRTSNIHSTFLAL